MIVVKENVNSVEEYNYMFDVVGWGHHEYNISKKALENTLYSVSIYDDDKIIGFGRIIGDGACYLYIHDITVVPEYQSKGIGTMVMKKLIERIKDYKKEYPNIRVYLGAAKGKDGFYKKLGFITREEANLGSGMILK